ncbi:hypothetical protein GCM10009647_058850 [Streptomyces sanglieri]
MPVVWVRTPHAAIGSCRVGERLPCVALIGSHGKHGDRESPDGRRDMRARIDRMSSASRNSDVHADISTPSQRPRIRPVLEDAAGPGEQAVPNDYDSFADR